MLSRMCVCVHDLHSAYLKQDQLFIIEVAFVAFYEIRNACELSSTRLPRTDIKCLTFK